MTNNVPITVARGDGIGPEIMDATLRILEAAGAHIEPEFIDVGEKVYLDGNTTGVSTQAWQSIKRTKVLLKAPITTPQGGGFKSVNVTMRKTLGLYANVRPCRAYHPFVFSHFPDMDVVIVRENEEGLYAGIEHKQTANSCQTLKLFTHQGCERIIRYAFEYAKKFNRRKITCMSKDNIMKMTDGMFHKIFKQVAEEYPGFHTEHLIVDIGSALLATRPERFDVVVTPNLYGDIISDVTAQITGSVGLAGSANIGRTTAMFEAIHGSAPDIAGKNIANPSGLLNGAVQLLIHIDQSDVAAKVENAWLKTIEDGMHTADIFSEQRSIRKLSTKEFADAVIERLGEKPTQFHAVSFQSGVDTTFKSIHDKVATLTTKKEIVGADIFIDALTDDVNALCSKLSELNGPLKLIAVTNRGLKVWPNHSEAAEFFLSDHWCCRFQATDDFAPTTQEKVLEQITLMYQAAFDVIKIENLYTFDGERGFSLAQGQ